MQAAWWKATGGWGDGARVQGTRECVLAANTGEGVIQAAWWRASGGCWVGVGVGAANAQAADDNGVNTGGLVEGHGRV